MLGNLTADKVVRLTKEVSRRYSSTADKQEMASESMKAMNARIQEQNLFNSKGVGEVQVGVLRRCHCQSSFLAFTVS